MDRTEATQIDAPRGKPGHTPERTCAVTRAKLAPADLIRFVLGPESVIVPDVAGKLPGRGVWISCQKDIVAEAAKKGAFARSLKAKVIVPEGLEALVEALLVKRAQQALSFANKAGTVVTGFTKVDIAIAKGEAIAVVHAREAADDGKDKLDRKFKAVWAEMEAKGEPPIIGQLTGDELSLALGRSNVVHAVLTRGGAATHFLEEAGRVARYRSHWRAEAAAPLERASDTEQV